MNSTVPLPDPDCRGVHFDGYSSDALRTYAAAQSAADNAALRGELIRAANFELDAGRIMRHEPMLNGFEDLWALEAERESLEQRVIKADADNAVLIANLAAAMSQFALEETDNDVLREELKSARRTAEFWKANHLAGNERIKVLEDALHMVGLLRRLGGVLPSANQLVQTVVEAARVALEKPHKPPEPDCRDCRTCRSVVQRSGTGCGSVVLCTRGDRYEAMRPIHLWTTI